jgi:D-3-phosphoglycerate dehydrogenase
MAKPHAAPAVPDVPALPWKVLVSDPLSEDGIAILRNDPDFEVVVKTDLDADGLRNELATAVGLLVRSQTKVTAEVLAAAPHLKVIGRAGVGVDNIDVEEATRRGIVVVNSPEGNTIAAAEHSIALLLALSRNIPQANASMKAGEWKRSKFTGVEVNQKTLGVIGLGKIGLEVVRRARGLGMQVIGHDPFVTAERAERMGIRLVELPELFQTADYITVHAPLNANTRGLIGKQYLDMVKPGVRIINCARGGIVDEAALAEAVQSGKVAGAALDVFDSEPPKDSAVIGLDKVIATPHLGASTAEAQIKVAVDVAEQIVEVLHGRSARSAVNLPPTSPELLAQLGPHLALAEKIGRLQAQLADGAVTAVEVTYGGDLLAGNPTAVTPALLKGLLQDSLSHVVNHVNASSVAASRGIRVTEVRLPEVEDYAHLISVRATTDRGSHTVVGTIFGRHDLRIVRLDDYHVDFLPEGFLLVTLHVDRPGIIGAVGTLLGDAGINIGGMQVGRAEAGGTAVMVLAVDSLMSDEVRQRVDQIEGIQTTRLVEL